MTYNKSSNDGPLKEIPIITKFRKYLIKGLEPIIFQINVSLSFRVTLTKLKAQLLKILDYSCKYHRAIRCDRVELFPRSIAKTIKLKKKKRSYIL